MWCSGVTSQQIGYRVQFKATRWTVSHTIGRRMITAFWTIHWNLVLVFKEKPSSNTPAKPSQTALSVFKVPHSGEDHREVVFISRFYYLFITNRTTRLNDRCDAIFDCFIDAVAKWEECVGSHDAAG